MKRSTPLVVLLSALALAACGDDGDPVTPPSADAGLEGPAYVVGSLLFGPDGTTSYVSVLDSLAPQTIDYDQAREFSGSADVWVEGGKVFVAEAETLTITRFAITDHQLVEEAQVSFAAYGLTEFGFWLNTFASPTKAYFLNGSAELIVWNPSTMEITGTVDLPALEVPAGLKSYPAYADRGAVVRDGKLYQPFYFTDETYFAYTAHSSIVVVDTATDAILETIDAPCPGLDYATVDEKGDIYFSSWVFAAGAALVLDQPDTCVFTIPETGTPARVFGFPDVTEGRQGAALRSIGANRWLFSVLHGERVELGEHPDASAITFGPNWRFWTYDMTTHAATPIESMDWNAGAQYSFDIDGKIYMLVAAGDYTKTTVYEVGDGSAPTPLFDTRGWSVRAFKVH